MVQYTTLEFSPIFSAFHINHSFARQLEHLIQIALESLHRLMQVSRRGTQKKSGALGFHGRSMGIAGLWHFSQVSFVRRERTNNAIDSPWNSASVDVTLMPRQTKSCRQKGFSKTIPSVFGSIERFFYFFYGDHSFAGRDRIMQSIAHEILHRLMLVWCPGKRMQIVEYWRI